MASLKQRLTGHQIIGLDTAIFIYHLEGNEVYLPLTRQILEMVENGQCQGVVSTITLMELTVHPWRVNRGGIARQYEVLLVNFPNVRVEDVTREVARKGAQLRGKYNLRPADALQVATGLVSEASLWISNDKGLRRLESEIEVMILDDHLDEKTAEG